jgi:S-disulfanyl-L-cysteine oxidoreductase SoxD
MKLRFLFGVLAVIWLAGVTQFSARAEQAAAAPGASKTVWDGVFSQEQADRGAAAYKTACSECHGNDLAGDGFAPALSGSDFMGNWNELSVGDLFERIRISMPPSGPSAVTPAQKADIVAHLMSANKFPAGTTELEPKTEVLKGIKIEMKK